MFCINVWVKVKDPVRVAEVATHLTEAARSSRTEPGCQQFDLYQSQADISRFLLVEGWESEQAWQAHRQAAAYTQIYQPLVLPHVERDGHISTKLV